MKWIICMSKHRCEVCFAQRTVYISIYSVYTVYKKMKFTQTDVTFMILTMLLRNAITKAKKQQLREFQRTDSLQLIIQAVGNTPPNFNDDWPTTVECELYVDSFDSIDEVNMDFTVSILLHLSWLDERFLPWAPTSGDNASYLEFDSKNLENFWIPDIFFPNEKKAFFHNVFLPNKMLRVYSGGRVSYTARISLTLSCNMDLRSYPFDQQHCCIQLEISYNEHNVIMKWANESDYKAVDTRRGVDLPKFRLTDIAQHGSFTHRKGSGQHSTLTAIFSFERNTGYYIVQMYIPSILVVMLSWISFWLNLTPRYLEFHTFKAIDIWMAICLLFVFSALLEFAIANVLSRKDTNKGFKFKSVFFLPLSDSRRKKKRNTELVVGSDGEMKLDPESDPTLQRPKKHCRGELYAMYLDVACRFFFPLLFLLFNLIYWTMYLSNSSKFSISNFTSDSCNLLK
ncbi:hypothetical protein KUTeg_024336 [Tegillarca granosa]|uniref:Neurotransmitter-gated ion-channel ligand-binding domain-containing protein n=1 Tax=Tegillarca granosa TaxID=220873 RepID=A0ABQ9E2S7_TEGGR|nr:hypothetical protein KUTeg_024336 [Tegillarca granosa]